VGGYLLTYRVTQNRIASLVGGYVFAFMPYIFMRLGGHWNVYATWPLPFFMYFVLRLIDTRSWKDAAWAGVFLSITTYNWIEFAVDAGMACAIFLVYWSAVHLIKKERERLITLCRQGPADYGPSRQRGPAVLQRQHRRYRLPGDPAAASRRCCRCRHRAANASGGALAAHLPRLHDSGTRP
jgi:hypothetical protein